MSMTWWLSAPEALAWSEREEEFVKRAGFVLMVQVAGKDKGAPAELLHRYLARAEREAGDERNFVKKAVSWTIREIGQRGPELNEAAARKALMAELGRRYGSDPRLGLPFG